MISAVATNTGSMIRAHDVLLLVSLAAVMLLAGLLLSQAMNSFGA